MPRGRKCCGKSTVPGQGADDLLSTAACVSASPLPPEPWEKPKKVTEDEDAASVALLSKLSAIKVGCPRCHGGFVREMTSARDHFLCACSIK